MNETVFGKNLKRFREERGLSRQEIAEKLNMRASSYGFYETGRTSPDVEKLKTIAEILQVSIDVLVGFHLDEFQSCQNFWQEKYHKIVVGADNSIEMTLPVYGVNKIAFEEGKYYVDGYVKVIRFLNKQAFIDFTKEAQNKYQARISSYYSEIANNFYNDLEEENINLPGITAMNIPFKKAFVFEKNVTSQPEAM